MKILLHSCCGPCSIFPIEFLNKLNFKIEPYFYNHNIHPVEEYYKRLYTFIQVAEHYKLNYHVDEYYGLKEFVVETINDVDNRCIKCYTHRLEKSAQKAKVLGIENFTTTLLYSKMQKHDDIKSICENIAKNYNLNFIYHDFRIGWSEGIETSKELNIYRQNYCGCIFSEEDRFLNQLSRKYNKSKQK